MAHAARDYLEARPFLGVADLPDDELLSFAEGYGWDAPSHEELSNHDLFAIWDAQLAYQRRGTLIR